MEKSLSTVVDNSRLKIYKYINSVLEFFQYLTRFCYRTVIFKYYFAAPKKHFFDENRI